MTDRDIRSTYDDLLDDADQPALFAVIRTIESLYPRVQPPAELVDQVLAAAEKERTASISPARQGLFGRLSLSRYRPVRHSVSLAILVALAISLVGGVTYAMRVLGGPSRPHVVLSCSNFGARWTLAGAGARIMSPQQFAASGGRLVPGWRWQVASLQRPRYWMAPADADIVDTCRGASSSQIEVGTNQRTHAHLLAISVVPVWESNRPLLVGGLRIPPWGGCAPKPAAPPIKASGGRPVAQLAHLPAGFSRSVRVTLPPCSVSKRPVRNPLPLPPSKEVGFSILSQIEYRGNAGTVVVLTARPSPAALRLRLNLGIPAGTLRNGRRVWNLRCAGSSCPWNDVRWMQSGLIVSVSGDLSVDRLKALAADVVLR